MLQWASNIALEDTLTEHLYIHETDNAQVAALSRMTTNIEQAFDDRLGALVRKYGSVSNIALTKRNVPRANYLLAGTIVFVTLAALSYLAIYPQAYVMLQAWWAINGMYAIVTIFMVMAIGLMLFWRRRTSRRRRVT